jgi:hypothetical protein
MPGYTLTEQGRALRIALPKGTNWVELILGTAATALFTKILLPAAIHSFQQRPWHVWDHMLMYGGFGFALSLVSCLLLWIWVLLGKQSVTLDGLALIHRREILGIGFSREYDWSAVQDFRLRIQARTQNAPNPPAAANFLFNLRGAAVMAFDYGARTFELGKGLDESSARELVALINQRFPSNESPAGNS